MDCSASSIAAGMCIDFVASRCLAMDYSGFQASCHSMLGKMYKICTKILVLWEKGNTFNQVKNYEYLTQGDTAAAVSEIVLSWIRPCSSEASGSTPDFHTLTQAHNAVDNHMPWFKQQ
jgi:hypothetical protein